MKTFFKKVFKLVFYGTVLSCKCLSFTFVADNLGDPNRRTFLSVFREPVGT